METSVIYINHTDMNLNGLVGSIGSPGTPRPGDGAGGDRLFAANAVAIGERKWVFKEDVSVYGLSFAKEIAGVSVGVDLVRREDQPLAPNFTTSLFFAPGTALSSYDSDNFPGSVGDTYAVNINGLGLLNGDKGLWDGGSWLLEATFSMLDSCNENCALLDDRVSEDRVVSQVFGLFTPTWYQVRPGWDMSIPMAVNYTIDGEKSPVSFGGDEEGGSASLGVRVDIDQLWKIDLAYNIRFGPVLAGIGGLLKDRDNISLTVKRTW